MMRRLIVRLALTSLAALSACSCDAAIVYQFVGTGSDSDKSFRYIAPTFITSNLTVSAGVLASCTAPATTTCKSEDFYVDTSPLNLNGDIADAIVFQATNGNGWAFYFVNGALTTLGTYASLALAFEGSLIVSESSTVPEPATLVLLLAGMGGIAVAGARRRSKTEVPRGTADFQC